jgi:hypothetical protein
MIVGHIFGIPVEETVVQFAPAVAATVTVIAIAGRTKLGGYGGASAAGCDGEVARVGERAVRPGVLSRALRVVAGRAAPRWA